MNTHQKIIIEYITHEESGHQVIYCPHLHLCFNAIKFEDALESLELGVKAWANYYRDLSQEKFDEILKRKGVHKDLTSDERENINKRIMIPFDIVKSPNSKIGIMEVTL